MLTREQLLTKETPKIQKVDFDNGEFVFVRQMNGRARDRFERSLMREVKDRKGGITYKQSVEDYRAKLAVYTVCDEAGELLFKPEDYPSLSESILAIKLDKITSASNEINGITEAEKEAMIKNSEIGQIEENSSVSADNLDTPTPTIG